MTLWRLVAKEILHRKLNFALGLLSVTAAVGCLVGALALLKAHDLRTQGILSRKEAETQARLAVLEDDIRKAMLRLGFNIVILPEKQDLANWYAEDYGAEHMPEEYVDRLAASKLVTIQHLLPSLQRRITWPEFQRTVILIGTRGEAAIEGEDVKKPLVQPVPPGAMVLGYELHRSLGLKVGDAVKLLGRQFTLARCQPERGNKDDITVWIPLADAQELLGKQGRINAILALECMCAAADVLKVREEIARILPGTKVVERGSEALARAEARRKAGDESAAAIGNERAHRAALRQERENLAAWLVPVVILAAACCIALLAFANARERRSEVALLRAVGVSSRRILTAFLAKAVVMGAAGGMLGLLGGAAVGARLGAGLDHAGAAGLPVGALPSPWFALAVLVAAPALAGLAGFLPAAYAAHQDPAEILREE